MRIVSKKLEINYYFRGNFFRGKRRFARLSIQKYLLS
jgi:hypothetical protein